MKYELVKQYVDAGFSTRKIAKDANISQSTIRYWLKKYGLKTSPLRMGRSVDFYCIRCETQKEEKDFYVKNKRDKNFQGYCKDCDNRQVVERQRRFKLSCLDYVGTSCANCGYCKCINALEFHHEDPNHKDFNISQSRVTNLNDKIKAELDKCVTLCSNCHRERHAAMVGY